MLGSETWLQWDRQAQTQELRKALRLEEATLRYGGATGNEDEARAKADGILRAIQIIDRFTRIIDTGEE